MIQLIYNNKKIVLNQMINYRQMEIVMNKYLMELLLIIIILIIIRLKASQLKSLELMERES